MKTKIYKIFYKIDDHLPLSNIWYEEALTAAEAEEKFKAHFGSAVKLKIPPYHIAEPED